MNLTSRFEPQRAAPVPPVDNSTLSNSLFPPYYSPRSSSLAQSNGPKAGNRSASPVSSITYTQVSLRDTDDNAKGSNRKPRSARRRYPRLCFDILPRSWVLEYISCLISVLAFVSMIVVLLEFDQRKLPSWPLGITLNTLIAFLTAICQSTFLYPVTQGLSQMKWNWFMGKNRPLGDFERFDNASRGAWGGVLLTFVTKGRLSVLLATVLLVTSAVTSTITQAVLTQSTRYVSANQNATVYQMINDNKGDYLSSINQVTGNIISAMYTSDDSYNFTDPICTSGNCQFPTFSSLAVCEETHDITGQLVFVETADECCNWNYTNKWDPWTWKETCYNCSYVGLARDEFISLRPDSSFISNSTSWILEGDWGSEERSAWSKMYSFSNESFAYNAIAGAQIIYLNDSTFVNSSTTLNYTKDVFMNYVRAAETLFFMCVETYNVTTTNGTTTTNITSVASNVYFDSWGYINDNEPDISYNRTFTVDGFNYTYTGVSGDLAQILQDSVMGEWDSGENLGLDAMTPFGYSMGMAMYNTGNISSTSGTTRDNLQLEALDGVLNNVARAITNWLRSYFSMTVQGQNFVSQSYVIVRWPYLIFLGVQILLSVVFLIWVILDSKVRKVDVLKDSGISALFALSAEDKENFEARFALLDEKSDEREDLERMSEVTLVKNEPGQWNLKAVD